MDAVPSAGLGKMDSFGPVSFRKVADARVTGSTFGRRIVGSFGRTFAVLLAIVGIECVIATYVAMRYLDYGPLAVFDINILRLSLPLWFAIPLGWAGLVTVALIRRRNATPLKTFKRLIRYRSDWLVRGLLLFACYLPLAKAFGLMKTSIPFVIPFYLDPFLINLDSAVLGNDAWRISHQIFPGNFLYFFDRAYSLWFTFLYMLVSWSSFSRDPRLQLHSAIAFNLSWFLIGGVFATFLSSVGPCFFEYYYNDSRFAPLMVVLTDAYNSEYGLLSMRAMNFLLQHAGTGTFGAGISAMPSLHVSMCVFAVLMSFAATSKRWVHVLAIAYCVVITIGSVHLGWHYLSDGIVSGAMTVAIWFLAGKIVVWTQRSNIKG